MADDRDKTGDDDEAQASADADSRAAGTAEPDEDDDDEPEDEGDPSDDDGEAVPPRAAASASADAAPARKPPAAAKATPAAPEPEPGPPRNTRLLQVAVLAIVTVALDLWSKAWAWDTLREGKVITVVENWVYFEFGFNTGSAFSLGRDAGWARTAFIVVTLLALAYMGRLAMTLPTRYGVAFASVALVAGGALGNLHDRLVRVMEIRGEMRHGVVDFIKIFYWPGKVWPTFNVADVALVVGVGLLLIFLTKHGDALDAEAKKSA
jgi:signal peptidase II